MASQRLNGRRPKNGPGNSAQGKDRDQRAALREREGGTSPHAPPILLEYECCSVRHPAEYTPYIGAVRVEALKRLAGPVAGRRWVHINGTLQGGGVAELLQGILPLGRGLGLDTRWYALDANEEFFQVTKKFHHLLQGLDTPLTLEELFGAYLDAIDAAAQAQIAADLVVVHDPQPAAIIMPGALLGTVLWRCHLDTSTPHPKNQATVLEAFRCLRAERRFHPPPYLIFLGNTAADDPEGAAMLAQLQARAGEDSDVRFWVDVPDNDRVVGALLHLARGLVHVATREGFGLVVTEALWQGTPVIGATVGGIQQQISPGRTGYLVTPRDAAAMGRRGREHVRRQFLLPEVLRRDLILLRYYTGISRARPPFRVNGPAYREMLQTLWRSPSRAVGRR